jgi:subtilase family serine protease
VPFKFVWPTPSGANQGFQLLAQVDANNIVTERSEGNNVAFSPVTVAPAFVDLSGSLGTIPTTLVAGQRVRLPFTIQNNGNVPAKGAMTVRLLASSDDVLDTNDTEIISLPKKISLRPGKPRLLPLSFTMPSTLASGNYRLIVQIDSANTIVESNDTNNNAVSGTAFSV